MQTVSNSDLIRLAKDFSSHKLVGVALMGSYARDEQDEFSDIDLSGFHQKDLPYHHGFFYRNGTPISIGIAPVEQAYRHMKDPSFALAAVPSYRVMQILWDPNRILAEVLEFAEKFTWSSVQQKADIEAANCLAETAEEVQKALRALSSENCELAAQMAHDLTAMLTKSVAMNLGAMYQTENSYQSVVRAAVGNDSAWSSMQLMASGEAGGSALGRCDQAIRLYAETADILHSILTPEQRQTVAEACERIKSLPSLGH